MASNLHYNAVSSLLLEILKILMGAKEFKDFRLVGGTGVNRKKKYSDFGKMKCSKFGNKSAVFSGTILQ